jgi:hypothetical protein
VRYDIAEPGQRYAGKPQYAKESVYAKSPVTRASEREPSYAKSPPVTRVEARLILHIRLDPKAAKNAQNLYPLRTFLYGRRGPCSVHLHVPRGGGGEVVLRVSQSTGAGEDAVESLKQYEAVEEAWMAG